jgi:hypothetical protein
MENSIQTLLEKFKCHNTTHPILSKIWTESLEDCKLKLYYIEKIVEQGERLITKLPDDVNDPKMNTILLCLSLLSDSSNNCLE